MYSWFVAEDVEEFVAKKTEEEEEREKSCSRKPQDQVVVVSVLIGCDCDRYLTLNYHHYHASSPDPRRRPLSIRYTLGKRPLIVGLVELKVEWLCVEQDYNLCQWNQTILTPNEKKKC